MKIFPGNHLSPEETSFNAAQIRTRRVVECAIGRSKERFVIVAETNSNDPRFASEAALLCCGLHNIIERSDDGYLPNPASYVPLAAVTMHPSPAASIRNSLAHFVHNL